MRRPGEGDLRGLRSPDDQRLHGGAEGAGKGHQPCGRRLQLRCDPGDGAVRLHRACRHPQVRARRASRVQQPVFQYADHVRPYGGVDAHTGLLASATGTRCLPPRSWIRCAALSTRRRLPSGGCHGEPDVAAHLSAPTGPADPRGYHCRSRPGTHRNGGGTHPRRWAYRLRTQERSATLRGASARLWRSHCMRSVQLRV